MHAIHQFLDVIFVVYFVGVIVIKQGCEHADRSGKAHLSEDEHGPPALERPARAQLPVEPAAQPGETQLLGEHGRVDGMALRMLEDHP